jgi:hypothetical protein
MALAAVLEQQQTQTNKPIPTTLVDSAGRPLSIVEELQKSTKTPTREDTIEANSQLAKQTQLLEIIANAVSGKGSAGYSDSKSKSKEDNSKMFSAATGGIVGAITVMLLNTIKFLGSFVLRAVPQIGKLLLATVARFGLLIPTLVIGVFKGLFDSIKLAFSGADFGDVVTEFVSSLINFLSFGFISKETVKNGISILTNAVKDYIIDPIMNLFSSIENFFKTNIFDPIEQAFKPIVDFFTNIKNTILNFFEGLSIPEIKFTIPIVNKEVSIGPFSPFKKSPTVAPQSSPTLPAPSNTEGVSADLSGQTAPITPVFTKPIVPSASPIKMNRMPTEEAKNILDKNKGLEDAMNIRMNGLMMSASMSGGQLKDEKIQAALSEIGSKEEVQAYLTVNKDKISRIQKYANEESLQGISGSEVKNTKAQEAGKITPAPSTTGTDLTNKTIAAEEAKSSLSGTTNVASTPITTINNAPTQQTTLFGKSPRNDESSINRYIDRSYGVNI